MRMRESVPSAEPTVTGLSLSDYVAGLESLVGETRPHLKDRTVYLYRLFADEPPINMMRDYESDIDDEWLHGAWDKV